MTADPLTIPLPDGGSVSGLWLRPDGAHSALALAHGAGAGMTHPSMAALAEALGHAGVATLRYQFPYMERGSKRVDAPATAHTAVRSAVEVARDRAQGLPLFAGGRSFGGRMTSQAQAAAPLDGVAGLVFFAFPLHPAGKPSTRRAEHLSGVETPMLFVTGDRDALAEMTLLRPVLDDLGGRATLQLIAGGDHSFKTSAALGRKPQGVLQAAADDAAAWMRSVAVRG